MDGVNTEVVEHVVFWHTVKQILFELEQIFYSCLSLQSAYKKDDFFDTISCNSLTRGSRNGQNRFSERMKQDTEVRNTLRTVISGYEIIRKLQCNFDVLFIHFLFRHLAISSRGIISVMVLDGVRISGAHIIGEEGVMAMVGEGVVQTFLSSGIRIFCSSPVFQSSPPILPMFVV